jgi:enamine deaminase RidA (YjgF/YER057c/UK114 family)
MLMSNIEIFNPPTIAAPKGYSHVAVVTSGKIVFIAGQVALAPDGTFVGEGDPRAQAEQVFRNLQAALEAAGGNFSHVVKLNFYVTDVAHLPIYREVRDQFIDTARPPASTAVEVRSLFRPECLIEIEAVAAIS